MRSPLEVFGFTFAIAFHASVKGDPGHRWSWGRVLDAARGAG